MKKKCVFFKLEKKVTKIGVWADSGNVSVEFETLLCRGNFYS